MTATARLRSALPERAKDSVRLALAGRLETSTRDSSALRGAALVLHAVAPRGGDPERELDPPVTTEQLDLLVSYLGRRYAFVRASELVPRAQSREPGEPVPLALTFDDDLASHLVHAAPVLAHHEVVATVFLCGARRAFWWQALQHAVDTRALRRKGLPEVAPTLTEDALERQPWALARLAKAIEDLEPERRDAVDEALHELVPELPAPLDAPGARALADAGWEIGFHTLRHDVLAGLDEAQLAAALRVGRERLPVRPRAFAYPHGKAGAREAAAAQVAGYDAAFTGAAQVVTERTDPHLIGRLQLHTDVLGRFALRLARKLADAGAAWT